MPKKRIFLSPPLVSGQELELIKQVFESNYIAPLGPMVDKFEKEIAVYTGYKYCVALSSGTAAIHLALLAAGIQKNDHVWASDLTFIGSVSPVTFCGAIPTFVDAAEEDWNIDIDLLEENLKKIKNKSQIPKIIIATDLYGQMCEYSKLMAVCEKYGIMLLGDSAEAFGASFNGSKSLPPVSLYSFNGNKIITTAGGGAIASNKKEIIDYARFLSMQARDPYPYYEHSVIGYNYRMSNVLAAIGVGQLAILDQKIDKKREIYNYYKENLSSIDGIKFMKIFKDRSPNYWLTVVIFDESTNVDIRDIIKKLEENNIESRHVWKPMHMQPVFSECTYLRGQVSERLFRRGVCLPSGACLLKTEQDQIISIIKKCLE